MPSADHPAAAGASARGRPTSSRWAALGVMVVVAALCASPALAQVPFERFASDYHFDTEIIISFVHHKLRIKEMPIPTHYGDEENYVNIWDYGMKVLITTFSYFLHRNGLRKSRNWKRIFGE